MSCRPHGFSSTRRLGLIVNPIAGLGGRVGLKGSDGLPTQTLARQLGAVSPAQHRAGEAEAIQRYLADIQAEVDKGTFHAAPSDEDIHTAVERLLTERLGPVAGKLHTGRSRNDQVATDLRLWIMAHTPRLAGCVLDLQETFLRSALADLRTPMPGYTHLRQAHEFVGQAILKAESLGVGLDQMRPEDWQAVSPLFGEEMAGLFDVVRALDRRAAGGGTAVAALQAQAEAAQGWLASRGRPAVEPNGAGRG